MELYQRLADDLRTMVLVFGVVIAVWGRKEYKQQLFPWLGIFFILYGSTQYIPGTETWSGFLYVLVPISAVAMLVDGVMSYRREGKPLKAFLAIQVLAFILWASFAFFHYRQSRFEIEMHVNEVVIRRAGETLTMKREKLRILESGGMWHLKDGVENIGIRDYELYRSKSTILSAKEVTSRLSRWTGRKIELVPNL